MEPPPACTRLLPKPNGLQGRHTQVFSIPSVTTFSEVESVQHQTKMSLTAPGNWTELPFQWEVNYADRGAVQSGFAGESDDGKNAGYFASRTGDRARRARHGGHCKYSHARVLGRIPLQKTAHFCQKGVVRGRRSAYTYQHLCGRSSAVERHVANVNVVSSNLIARFFLGVVLRMGPCGRMPALGNPNSIDELPANL